MVCLGGPFMLLIDGVTIFMGIYLLIAPDRAYNFGQKGEARTPPKNWRITGRIIGVVAILLGLVFIYFDLRTK